MVLDPPLTGFNALSDDLAIFEQSLSIGAVVLLHLLCVLFNDLRKLFCRLLFKGNFVGLGSVG